MADKKHVTEGLSDEWHQGDRAGSWILEENLKPFVIHACSLTGYRFDDMDWIAIQHGVSTTNDEAGRWFDYPLGRLNVEFARSDPTAGTGIMAIGLDLTRSTPFERGQLEMLIRLMQEPGSHVE